MRDDVASVDTELFNRIWAIATEIGVQERHFNGLQTGYRNMASGWLLATFGAMGFVLTQKIDIGLDRELIIALIALAGGTGIALLWVLDLLVYHHLLDACFIEGLILERRYAWLPPFRSNMMAMEAGSGVLARVIAFYLVPVAVMLCLAGAALALWLYHAGRPVAAAIALLAGPALAIAVGWLMRGVTANTDVFDHRISESERPKTG